MTTYDDVEPMVLLPSGARVLLAIYQIVTTLQGSGHLVSLDDEGEVWVTPIAHENAMHILATNTGDVREVLALDESSTVH